MCSEPPLSDIYEPLNPLRREIRFFRLLPGPDSSQVSGTVESNHERWMRGVSTSGPDIADQQSETVAMRPREPYYEALSYEWGDADGTKHTILVNGRPFSVRDNLFQALRRFRSQSLLGPFWIDALCIDQSNIKERNHQVGMMSLIYSFAGKVRVWLGQEDSRVTRAFNLVSRIADNWFLEERKSLALWKVSDRDHEKFLYLASSRYLGETGYIGLLRYDTTSALYKWTMSIVSWLETISSQEWEALITLLDRSYWTRIWIVQEYFLAEDITICCGSEDVDGQELQTAMKSIRMLRLDTPGKEVRQAKEAIERVHNTVGTKMVEMRMFREDSSLLELLESTKESKCHDPHDRIYAITALAEDISCFYETIPIDYTSSIFMVKMDLVWAVQTRSRFKKDYISRLCSLLDEIFADYPDDE